MFPEPLDAELVARLDAIKDTEPQLYFTLHPILDAANTLRIGEWRVAYWSVYVSLNWPLADLMVELADKGISGLYIWHGACRDFNRYLIIYPQ